MLFFEVRKTWGEVKTLVDARPLDKPGMHENFGDGFGCSSRSVAQPVAP